MKHADFEVGEHLFDTIHCRTVEILEIPSREDMPVSSLPPGEYYVQAKDGSEDTYVQGEKHLYTPDEISAALSHKSIDNILKEMRKSRLQEKCKLLQYIDFHPDDITKKKITDLQRIDDEITRITNKLRKRFARMYLDGNLPGTTEEDIMAIIRSLLLN